MIKVLIVDDNEPIRMLCQEWLTEHDFDVQVAEGGNQAKKVIEENTFDVVVTDLYMHDGGGQQLIEWCMENYPEIKLLAVSGQDADATLSALDIVGDKGIPTLEKPFKMKHLSDIIKGIVGNQFLD